MQLVSSDDFSVSTGTSSRLTLTEYQEEIAFTLWNRERKRLNKYQKEAIKTAWGKEFTLIQGPPGMSLQVVSDNHRNYAVNILLCRNWEECHGCSLGICSGYEAEERA